MPRALLTAFLPFALLLTGGVPFMAAGTIKIDSNTSLFISSREPGSVQKAA